MIRSYSLSNTDIDSLLNLPEVIRSKEQIDAQTHSGAIYLNASLDDSLHLCAFEMRKVTGPFSLITAPFSSGKWAF